MSTLRIYGHRDHGLREQPPAGGGLLPTCEVRDAIRLSRDRGEDAVVELEGLADDEVLELRLADGLRVFRRFDALREELDTGASRGPGGGLVLPPALRVGDAQRGAGALAIEAVRRLGVDLAGETAEAVARRLEERLDREPGLYRWRGGRGFEPADPADLPADRPALLFLHGTMSSTTGSFGALAGGRVWKALVDAYGAGIFAFEHRTLTESPLENAVELLESLPADRRLHLVSHSRGGLVGELLSRGGRRSGTAVDELDRAVFRDGDGELDRERDLVALARLATLLGERRPRVERFVRVACPAAGTILASDRLDRYLNVVTNLLGLIPGLRATPVYDVAVAFLLAVVKERTRPERIPGLEAQMPESPLMAMVNRPDVTLDGELAVIAGDIEPRGVLERLAVLAADAFFREEHDLVVNTAAMLGGARRSGHQQVLMVKGGHVNHFRYFENEDTALAVAAALKGARDGFEPLSPARGEGPERTLVLRRGGAERPTVLLVPGLMGSHLEVGGDRVWMQLLDLALGGMGKLGRDAEDVEAPRFMDGTYGDLAEFLSESHDVVPFPYDWRRSLLELGAGLGDAVEEALDASRQPVRIVAHSMGGLVTRAMVHRRPGVWERLTGRPGHRVVMMGTPLRGSYSIPLVLLGREASIRKLALLDLRHSRERLLEIVARFQGLLDLLPDDEDFGLFRADFWDRLHALHGGWTRPLPEHLEAALACRAALDDTSFDPARVLYVAGEAPATPVAYRIDDASEDEDRVRFLATRRGDGRVPWDTGPPEGADVYYLRGVVHGDIPAHREAFPAYVELLEEGETRRISRSEPVARGEEDEPFELPPAPVDLFPDEAELLSAAVGGRRRVAPVPTAPPVRIRVSHGNLAFARHVLAVGHYREDMIVSAESALDYHLHGALRRRHALGAYPGPPETAEVVFAPPAHRPRGALVVGLGSAGELSPGRLTATLTRGLLELATAELERTSHEPRDGRTLAVSSLLIGSGEGGVALGEALESTLRAVTAANRALADSEAAVPPAFTELELVELYEDRAIRALSLLRSMELPGGFRVEAELAALPGGRRRIYEEEDPGWWRRIEILGGADPRRDADPGTPAGEDGGGASDAGASRRPWDRLRFKALTDRARAERRSVWIQRAVMDELVDQAVERPLWDPELARTLFELLLPNDFKARATEGRAVELVLDGDAAVYPWELLEDPRDDGEPPSVQTGLVRRLIAASPDRSAEVASGDYALVVGNPQPIGPRLPTLPGATREAAAVAEVLRANGIDVTDSIEQRGSDVLKALFGRGGGARLGYRILHLAGHGVHRPAGEGGSGMVIGDGQLLGPVEVERLRRVPELVFLNCCHLGRVEGRRHRRGVPFNRLAANLGRAFIERGVRAVVAAGWAVNDSAAELFARTFYEGMLERGEAFGDAVRRARQAVWARYRDRNNTWGAYQCYGDHSFMLRVGGGRARSRDTRPFSAPAEALVELENVASDAEVVSREGQTALEEKLGEIQARTPAAWLRRRPEIRAALGRARARLGDFEEARRHLQELGADEPARYPVRSLEILADAEIRSAYGGWRDGPMGADDASARIRTAVDRVSGLRGLGETAERFTLLGRAHERLAAIRAGRPAEGGRLLDRARRWYGAAVDHHDDPSGEALVRALRVLAAQKWRDPAYRRVEGGWTRRAAAARYGHLAGRAREAAALPAGEAAGFAAGLLAAQVGLVQQIWDGAVEPGDFTAAVMDAWPRGGSIRAYRTVEESLDVLVRILRGAPAGEDGAPARRVADALDDIRAGLAGELDRAR